MQAIYANEDGKTCPICCKPVNQPWRSGVYGCVHQCHDSYIHNPEHAKKVRAKIAKSSKEAREQYEKDRLKYNFRE